MVSGPICLPHNFFKPDIKIYPVYFILLPQYILHVLNYLLFLTYTHIDDLLFPILLTVYIYFFIRNCIVTTLVLSVSIYFGPLI